MALSHHDAAAYADRARAYPAAPQQSAVSRKYALSTTSVVVLLPQNAKGMRPSLMRFSLPAGAIVYGAAGAGTALVPTTGTDGSGQIRDGDVMSPWGANQIALVAEAAATITISYLWL